MKKKLVMMMLLLICSSAMFNACGKEKPEEKTNRVSADSTKEEKETKPTEAPTETPEPTKDPEVTIEPEVLNEQDTFNVLKANSFHIWSKYGSDLWYGQYDDNTRVEAAKILLKLYEELNIAVGEYNGSKLAQAINDYYDTDKSKTIWETACAVVDVDGSEYIALYDKMMDIDHSSEETKTTPKGMRPEKTLLPEENTASESVDDSVQPFYWYDEDGDVWYWNGSEDEFIGYGNVFYIDYEGNLCSIGDPGDYGTPYYWYDEDGDVWYWDGWNEEYIGSGSEYYIDDNGDLGYSGDVSVEPYYYYDEDGDVWYGEEYIGSGNDYYIDEYGNLQMYEYSDDEEDYYWYDEDGDIWYGDEYYGSGYDYYIGDDGYPYLY